MKKIIAAKLLGEFWIPFLLAGVWTAFYLFPWDAKVEVKEVVKIFGPAFFLSSWMLGQFFRIKKQVNVDKNFNSIEQRLEAVALKLESHAEDFMGYTTGGDSWVWLMPGFWNGADQLELRMWNDSNYPAFDIKCEILDMNEKIDIENGKFWTRTLYIVNELYPNHVRRPGFMLDATGKNQISYNIFINTRSGSSLQQVRAVRMSNGGWSMAYRVRVGDRVVKLQIAENFPGLDVKNPDALFD